VLKFDEEGGDVRGIVGRRDSNAHERPNGG
jgi:hypothetical protein